MGAFLFYLLKSGCCLVVFYIFFKLLMSRSTFFHFNRITLLVGLLGCTLLPLIELTTTEETFLHTPLYAIHEILQSTESVILNPEQMEDPILISEKNPEINSLNWIPVTLAFIYGVGALVTLIWLSLSTCRLIQLIRTSEKKQFGNYVLVIPQQPTASFSWGKYIVISAADYSQQSEEILLHEMMHLRNHHTLDLLFMQIFLLVYWFNPVVWLLKRELQEVHEFEADNGVINTGIDATKYQLLLVKKAVGTRLYSMANGFNHSKLKKRITMMLKEKSNPWARLKYLYVLPLAAIAVTAFARPEISEKVEEISAVKVNDLAEIVEKKSEENVVKEPIDTTKNKVVVVGYRTEKKDSVLTSGKEKVAILVQGISGEGKPLVIINGKESDREVVNALNPERIESVSVIGPEKAIKIYGEKAKDGVMDIKLYSEKKFAPRKIEIEGINKTRLDALNSGAKSWGATFRSADGGKPLVIIDGKEATGDDPLANISPDRIRSISVLKDKTALAAYGDKGKNGVIEVNLLVKEEYQARQISIRAINDTVTSTIKVTASEE